MVRVAVGRSTAPDPAEAGREAALAAREPLAGAEPTLAVLVSSPHHGGQARAVLDAVHEHARPNALVGCVAQAVVAGRRELEREPAVAVWLAALPQPAETYRLEFLRTSSGGLLSGYQFGVTAPGVHLLLPDPYTFPTQALLGYLNAHVPGTTVLGGLVSGGGRPGLTRLFRDAEVCTTGAVGVRLPGVRAEPVVSQGCRPIGAPYTVTRASGGVIAELAGRPPLRLLEEIASNLPVEDQNLISGGLQLGLVIDEYKAELARGDFLIRAVTGADPDSGAIQVGEVVEVGTTVQFQVRDAASADADLRESLLAARAGRPPAGALLFTCTGRGQRMFDVPDHDAALIGELLGDLPLAGFFAAGELGPVGGKNFLHGFTASMALFPGDDG